MSQLAYSLCINLSRAVSSTGSKLRLILAVVAALAISALNVAHAQEAYPIGFVSTVVYNGGLNSPAGIAVDSNGNVFIADYSNNRIVEEAFQPNGTYVESFPITGLNSPYGVAVDASFNLYIANTSGGTVLKETYISAGNYTQSTIMASGNTYITAPTGIALDKNGNVYVSDPNTANILRLAAGTYTGTNIANFGTGLNAPYGIAVDSNLNVFIADLSSGVIELPVACAVPVTSGCAVAIAPTVHGTKGVAVDASNNVYISSAGAGLIYEEVLLYNGTYSQTTVTASGLNSVTALAIDNRSQIYATVPATNDVIKVSPFDGNFGLVDIGSPSPTLTMTFDFLSGGTLTSMEAVQKGSTASAVDDFSIISGGTCIAGNTYAAGATCTVNVVFTPKFAGTRYGAVEFLNSSGDLFASAYIYGTGVGPQVIFLPGVINTIGSNIGTEVIDAVDGNGDVFTANSKGLGAISYVTEYIAPTYTSSVQLFQAPAGNISDVNTDGAGNLYVTDYGSGIVYKLFAADNYQTFIAIDTDVAGPSGSAVDGDGNVYISSQDTFNITEITEVSDYTNVILLYTGTTNLSDIAVDGSGDVFMLQYSAGSVLELFAVNGAVPANPAHSTIITGLNQPQSIHVDNVGNAYIANQGTNSVLEYFVASNFTTHQTILSATQVANLAPIDMAIDGQGDIWVSTDTLGYVVELSTSTPPSLVFDVTAVGSTSTDSPQTVSIENIGNETLTFPSGAGDPSISTGFTWNSSGAGDCAVATTNPVTLLENAICAFPISFTPQFVGDTSGTLTLTDNSLDYPTGSSQQIINLNGTGTGAIMNVYADSYTIPFGSADPTWGYTTSGSLGSTSCTGNPTFVITVLSVAGQTTGTVVTTPTAIGTYTITISKGTFACESQYSTYNFFSAILTITKAHTQLILKTSNVTMTYGQTVPSLTSAYTLTGFTSPDTQASACTGAPQITTLATSSSPVGSYTISADIGSLVCSDTNTNYAIIVENSGLLKIVADTPTFVWTPSPAGITYGTPLGAGQLDAQAMDGSTAIPSGEGTYAYTYNGAAIVSGTTILPIGTDSICVVWTPVSAFASDFNATAAPPANCTNITVTGSTLTITANSPAAITYGTARPTFSSISSPATLPSGCTGTVVLTLTPAPAFTAPDVVGSYPIVPSGITCTPASGYEVVYVNGTYTVGKDTPSLAYSGSSTLTYGATLGSVTSAVTNSNSGTTITSDGTITYYWNSTNEGSGAAGASFVPPVGTGSGTLCEVWAPSASIDVVGALTYSSQYNSSTTFPPGTCETVTVTPVSVTVTTNNAATITYGATPTYSVTTIPATLPAGCTGPTYSLNNGNPANPIPVGSYIISASVSCSSNYTVAYNNTGTLTVNMDTPTLAFTGSTLITGQPLSTIVTTVENSNSPSTVITPDGTLTYYWNGTLESASYAPPSSGTLCEVWTPSNTIDISGSLTYASQYNSTTTYPPGTCESVTVSNMAYEPTTFGSVPVNTTSSPMTFTFTFSSATYTGKLKSIAIVTTGDTGLDYAITGGTCNTTTTYNNGNTCTVIATFKPAYAGLRTGAIELFNNGGNTIEYSQLISGIGTGPQTFFYTINAAQNIPASSAALGNAFNTPVGLTVDSAGNVFVTDSAAKSVTEISAGGTVTNLYTSGGTTTPQGIVVDGEGNLFFADSNGDRVRELVNVNGAYSAPVNIYTTTSAPQGIAIDAAGNLFLTFPNSVTAQIVELTKSSNYGTATTLITNKFTKAFGIALDDDANIYVTDNSANTLSELTAASSYGTVTKLYTFSTPPTGVAIDNNGNAYVTKSGADFVDFLASPSFATFEEFSSGSTDGLNFGVAFDGAGNIYTIDGTTKKVEKLNYATAPSLTFVSTTYNTVSSDSPRTVSLFNFGNTALTLPIPASGNDPAITPSSFTLQSGTSPECTLVTSSSASPGSVAADVTCTLPVSFDPQTVGAIPGTLVLTDNNLNLSASTQTINLNGTGTKATANLTLTTNNVSSPYGSTPNVANAYTLTGFIDGQTSAVCSGSPTITTTATAASPVSPPTYPINETGLGTLVCGNADVSYTITVINNTGVVTITQATANLTLTTTNVSSLYGSTPNVANAYTLTGFIDGQTSAVCSGSPVISTTATNTSPVSPPTYPINETGLGSLVCGNANVAYTITVINNTGVVTITKATATLTLTTGSFSSPYGTTPNVSADYTLTGFIGGQTSAVCTGAPTITTTATAASPVSPPTYPVTETALNTLTCSNANATYNITNIVNTGVITITQATANLTLTTTNVSSPFGSTPNVANAYTLSGFIAGQTSAVCSGSPVISTTATNTSPVSPPTYPINETGLGSLVCGNANVAYTITVINNTGVVTITKATATLTLTTGSFSSPYGTTPNVSADYTLTGFLGGQTSAVCTGAPTITTTATAASPVSPPTYPVTETALNTLTCSNANATYNITNIVNTGVITITQSSGTLILTSTNGTSTFGSTPNVSADYSLTGFIGSDSQALACGATVPTVTTTATATSPISPPTYPITAAVGSLVCSDANATYTVNLGSNSGVLTIVDETAASSGPANFGSVPVNTLGGPVTITFTFSNTGVISSTTVLTTGITGLDFTDTGSGTCDTNGSSFVYSPSGTDTCTMIVTFTPEYPGQRLGAVELLDGDGNIAATALLSGIGTGPETDFYINNGTSNLPASVTTVGSGFAKPTGLAVDAQGDLFITDDSANSVSEVLAAGGYTTVHTILATGLNSPAGIVVDGAGNIFFSDSGNNKVKEIVAAGGYTTVKTIYTSASGDGPGGIAIDGAGDLFVSYPNSGSKPIIELTAASGYTSSLVLGATKFVDAGGIALDNSGNLWVTDTGNGNLNELTGPTYATVTAITPANSLTAPTGLVIDANGNAYIDQTGATSVTELTAASSYATPGSHFGAFGSVYYGLAIDGQGNIYTIDGTSNTVEKLNYAVAPSLTFASTTYDVTSSDSPQTVTLSNFGNQPLTYQFPTAVNDPFINNNSFTLASGSAPECPLETSSSVSAASINASTACTLPVSFTPLSVGSISGTLTVTDNNLNNVGATQVINLNGTSTQATNVPLTLTTTSITLPYGSQIPSVQGDYTLTGFVVGDSSANCTGSPILSTAATPTSPVITPAGYPITAVINTLTCSSANATYVISIVNSGNVYLTQTTPAIVWTPATVIYGQSLAGALNAQAFAGISNFTNVSADGTFTYTYLGNTITATTILPFGSDQICVVFTPSAGFTADLTATAPPPANCVTLSMSAAPLTITATATATSIYGTTPNQAPNAPFTYTITGWITPTGGSTDTQNNVCTVPAPGGINLVTSATSSSNVGIYTIGVVPTMTCTGYYYVINTGELHVVPVTVTITPLPMSVVYDSQVPTFSYICTVGGVQVGTTNSCGSNYPTTGTPNFTSNVTARASSTPGVNYFTSNVGVYTLGDTWGNFAPVIPTGQQYSNFAFAFGTTTLTITTSPTYLTVQPNAITVKQATCQASGVPTPTYKITGLLNWDTQASTTTGAPSFTVNAEGCVKGTYPNAIQAIPGTLTLDQYSGQTDYLGIHDGTATLVID